MAKKAVICVFDGLRPDRVSEALTPNLWRFANAGTWYRENRSVFPSMTRVVTTSFATGSKPETHGIVDNAFYHPEVFSDHMLDTSNRGHLMAAEAHHKGRFVEAEGLGCALKAAGKSFAVVHTGSAGSANMVSHRAAEHGHWTFSIHGPDATQTPRAVSETVDRFGPLPATDTPKTAEVAYATRVFIEHVLAERAPDVALIWFVEPDTAYHYREIGGGDSVGVTRAVDAHFGEIVQAVAAGPEADDTLIIAMSDHGQITMTEDFDLLSVVSDLGFPTATAPGEGIEWLATYGMAVAFRAHQPGPARREALCQALMRLPQTGMLFTSERQNDGKAVDGTFPLSLVGLDHPRAPEIVWVGRSDDSPDQHGLRGSATLTAGPYLPVGGGMHGGLHPVEQNALLVFQGAGVPALGAITDPSDVTDIVPTLLHLLDVAIPSTMTGAPLAAVVREGRPEDRRDRLQTGNGNFVQWLERHTGRDRPIVLAGGRGPVPDPN